MKTFIGCLVWFFVLLFLLITQGCGTQIKVKGGTEHNANVSGEVKTVNEIVLRVDVSACEPLDGQDQAQCIKDTVAALGDLVELIKSLSCKDAACLGVEGV